VLTVEPGIYWPGVGGARQEDVAAVTEDGVRILSKFPKVLEL
jgi:Xaa-Pro aminopeptidase